MIKLVLDAVAFGLTLAIVFGFGPVFFTLLQTSIDRGFRQAAWLALGVMINDLMLVSLCVLTSVQVVVENDQEMLLFSIGAGIVLILVGLYTFMKGKGRVVPAKGGDAVPVPEVKDPSRGIVYIGKGFVLNVLNPFVWIFWFSAVAVTAGNFDGDKTKTMLFFAVTLLTSFSCDLLKAKGATFFKRFFDDRRISILNKAIGAALMVFGLYFIIRGVVKFI